MARDKLKGTGDLRDARRDLHPGRNLGGGRPAVAGVGGGGITLIEMMPIADFAGEFGWGYDGVDLFANYWLRPRWTNWR
jgi:hypothetical protein